MEYLKKFEKFESEDNFYTLIGRSEYIHTLGIPFTKSEIDVLQSVSKDIRPLPNTNMMTIHNKVLVKKLTDEWYLIRVTNHLKLSDDVFYKCDQLDGLIQCLKDKVLK